MTPAEDDQLWGRTFPGCRAAEPSLFLTLGLSSEERTATRKVSQSALIEPRQQGLDHLYRVWCLRAAQIANDARRRPAPSLPPPLPALQARGVMAIGVMPDYSVSLGHLPSPPGSSWRRDQIHPATPSRSGTSGTRRSYPRSRCTSNSLSCRIEMLVRDGIVRPTDPQDRLSVARLGTATQKMPA